MTRPAVRALQVGHDVATRLAGYLLTDLGASVVSIEAEDAPEPSPHSQFVHEREKRRVRVPSDDIQAEVATLLAEVDVAVVGPTAPAAVVDALVASGVPCAVITSHTASRFTGGPEDSMLAEAGSGLQWLQFGDRDGPHCTSEPLAGYATALIAVSGALLGLLRARSGHHVGLVTRTSYEAGAIACQAVSATFLDRPEEAPAPRYRDKYSIALTPAIRFHRAADGWVMLGALSPTHWHSMLDLVGRADLLEDPRLSDAPLVIIDQDAGEAVARAIGEYVGCRAADDVLSACRARGIIAAPVLDHAGFLASDQCAGEKLLRSVVDEGVPRHTVGGFVRTDGLDEGRPSPMRLEAERPLLGIRVVDLSNSVATPTCSRILADLGADVIKVEPLSGDPVRSIGLGFSLANRNKRSLALDLKAPGAGEVLARLMRWADVATVNQTPNVLAALGMTADELRASNEDLIVLHVSGYGVNGPMGGLPAIDGAAQAVSGMPLAQGGGTEPVGYVGGVLDCLTGWLGVSAVLSALLERALGTRRWHLSTSLLATGALLQSRQLVDRPDPREPRIDAERRGYGPLTGLYRTADGWLCLGVQDEASKGPLAALIGLELDVISAPAADIVAAASEAFAKRTTAAWASDLDAGGFEWGVARTLREASRAWPDLFVGFEQRPFGRVLQSAPLLTVDGAPSDIVRRDAPEVPGADVLELLHELGFDDDDIDRLDAGGAIRKQPVAVKFSAMTV